MIKEKDMGKFIWKIMKNMFDNLKIMLMKVKGNIILKRGMFGKAILKII